MIMYSVLASVLAAATIAEPDTIPLDGRGGGILSFNTDRDGNQEVYVMNADGSGQRNITNNPANDGFGSWSPDGASIAFVSDRDGMFGVWIMDVEDLPNGQFGLPRKLADKRPSSRVCWSPDGLSLIFDAWPECDIYLVDVDGSNLRKVTNTPEWESQPTFSPDGSTIAFSLTANDSQDICIMNSDGSDRQKITNDGVSYFPAWSPDGSRIAFNSSRPGRLDVDICITNIDGSGRVWLTNYANHDEFPAWSSDGTRIAYQSARNPHRIYMVNSDGSSNQAVTFNTTYANGEPGWRPDSPCSIGKTGDVNQNDALTSADIIFVVNYVFKSGPVPQPCEAAADVNCDSAISSSDIIYLVSHVFKGGPPPCDVCTAVGLEWTCT